MNPCELTALITAIANAVATNFSDEEIAVLAASFTQLGDTLETILVQKENCCNCSCTDNKTQKNSRCV